MKIKKNIALSDSGFVFNPSSGDSYSVNPIGIELIKMMKEEKGEDEIKQYVMNTYAVDEATAEKDFYDFIKMLEQYRLIQKDEA
jgi:hypothetical protein